MLINHNSLKMNRMVKLCCTQSNRPNQIEGLFFLLSLFFKKKKKKKSQPKIEHLKYYTILFEPGMRDGPKKGLGPLAQFFYVRYI